MEGLLCVGVTFMRVGWDVCLEGCCAGFCGCVLSGSAWVWVVVCRVCVSLLFVGCTFYKDSICCWF